MKKVLILCLALVMVLGCRKEYSANQPDEQLTQMAYRYLLENMPAHQFETVNFNNVIITHEPVTFLRIGFNNENIYGKFILLKAGATQKIEGAKIIELAFSDTAFNGTLTRFSLDRSAKEELGIENGYLRDRRILATQAPFTQNAAEDDGHLSQKSFAKLYTDGPSMRAVDYISLEHAWERPEPTSAATTAYYQRNQPPPPATQYGGGGGNNTSPAPPVIKVDIDTYQPRPAMDIRKMIDCFNSIPDQGATCSIELCADVPVDSRPGDYVDSYSTYPGHAFIQLKKSNQGKTMTQNIGFYPVKGWKTMLTPAPVPGKFIDDSQHEYNASYKVNITFWQLQSVLKAINELAEKSVKYDIDNYNCTDFALGIFNIVRPNNPFTLTKYNIPMGQVPCYTPQALYLEIVNYRTKNPGEKFNIKLSTTTKSYVEATNTPCR